MVQWSYCLVLLVTVWGSSLATAAGTVQVREDCTRDPEWESRNNVGDPSHCVDKVQDFGFGATNHAGGSAGEIGGRVWRIESTRPQEALSYDVSPSMCAGDAALDRFGFLSWHRGGHYVEICFDDLEYTASAARTRRSSTER